jgi:hypothetical protein
MYNNKTTTIMKKLSVWVKQVLMSTVTVAMIAMSFTACSDDDVMNEASDLNATQAANNEPLKAVGLMYNDFINLNDVQILNADTTMISISKEFAEKKGLDNFVNRPMGIWLTFRERSFLRKGVSQRLEGDRYIVEVVEATIEDVLQPGADVAMKTGLYVNPAAAEQAETRSAQSMERSLQMEALLTDEEGCLHPAAIQFPGANETRNGMSSCVNYSPMELLGMMNESGVETRSSIFGDIFDVVVHAAENVFDPFHVNRKFIEWVTEDDEKSDGDYDGRLVNYDGVQTVSKKFQCGEGKNDTITVKGRLPMKLQVNYNLDLKVGGTLCNPRMDYFRASLDGEMKTSPELTIGLSRSVELPKDLQKIELCTFPEVSITFTPYGIPINITFRPNLYIKLKAQGEGSLYAGIKYEYDSKFVAGAEYKDSKWKDLTTVQPIKNQFSFIPPTANFKVNAGAGVMIGCDILFEKVVGPSLSAGPQISFKLDLKVDATSEKPITFTGNSKIGFWGDVGAKVWFWKWKLFDYSHEFDFGLSRTIWDYKYPDASNDKNHPVTKVLDTATELIKSVQDEVKSKK